jgi:hypothetical protein
MVKYTTQKSKFILLFSFVISISTAQSPALRFTEASNNFVQWNESATLIESNPDFTIEMWVKSSTIISGSSGRMLYCEGSDSNSAMFRLFASSGKVYVRPNGVIGAEQLASTTVVFDATAVWHHIAVVGTTPGGIGTVTTLKLYIDGILEATNTYTRNTADYDRSTLGNLTRTASQLPATAFDGEIDEFRLWSRALSASEIATNKCDPTSKTNLFRLIRFNEGSGTIVRDEVSASTVPISGTSPVWTTNEMCNNTLLTAYYPFNGNTNDESINNNNCSVIAATLTSDRFGNANSAYQFNGINQFLQIPDANSFSISTTSKLSISVWMRVDQLDFPSPEGDGYVYFLGKGSTGQHEWALRMYDLNSLRPNRVSAYAFNLTGGLGAGSFIEEKVFTGQWNNYVILYDYSQNQIQLYKNGQLKDTDTFSGYSIVPENGTEPIRIGTRDFSSYFKGAIDDVRFYNGILTPQEITSLYNEKNHLLSIDTNYFESIKVKIYPNPTTDYLNINTEKGLDLVFTLFDTFGRNVKEGKVESILDLSDLQKGIYILSIKKRNNAEVLTNKKIIKL